MTACEDRLASGGTARALAWGGGRSASLLFCRLPQSVLCAACCLETPERCSCSTWSQRAVGPPWRTMPLKQASRQKQGEETSVREPLIAAVGQQHASNAGAAADDGGGGTCRTIR